MELRKFIKTTICEYLNEQQQIWKNSNTKFFNDNKDRIFFYGKDNVKYQLIDNNLPNRPIKIEIRLADSRNLNPVAMSEFEKNNDGTYSQSMTGKLVVSKNGVGLAKAIYDYFDSVYGRIKPSKNLTDDGEVFWNKNKMNEGTINDFKYDAVKNQLQKTINNNSLTLDDISPNKYFIICFDLYNHHISTVSTTDKSEALKHIDYYKNIDDVWKIYVEKPNVDAIVFLRKEWGWVKK